MSKTNFFALGSRFINFSTGELIELADGPDLSDVSHISPTLAQSTFSVGDPRDIDAPVRLLEVGSLLQRPIQWYKVLPVFPAAGDSVIVLKGDDIPDEIALRQFTVSHLGDDGHINIAYPRYGVDGFYSLGIDKVVVVGSGGTAYGAEGFEDTGIPPVVYVNPVAQMLYPDSPAFGALAEAIAWTTEETGVIFHGEDTIEPVRNVNIRTYFDAFAKAEDEETDLPNAFDFTLSIDGKEVPFGEAPQDVQDLLKGIFGGFFNFDLPVDLHEQFAVDAAAVPKTAEAEAFERQRQALAEFFGIPVEALVPVNLDELSYDELSAITLPEIEVLLAAGKNDANILKKQLTDRLSEIAMLNTGLRNTFGGTRLTKSLTLSDGDLGDTLARIDRIATLVTELDTLKGNVDMLHDAFDAAFTDIGVLSGKSAVRSGGVVNG